MPNVEHSTLTGANSHEPKGIEDADEGTVYVADGAGSGTWQAQGDTASSFGNELLFLQDKTSAGHQTASGNAWNHHRLQTTVVNQISGASLAGDERTITLPAGTYLLDGWVSQYFAHDGTTNTPFFKARFYNITDASTAATSANMRATIVVSTYVFMVPVTIQGRFTIDAEKTFRVEYYLNYPIADGAGTIAASGIDDVFASIMIWKIA